jgi:hypothetical protein
LISSLYKFETNFNKLGKIKILKQKEKIDKNIKIQKIQKNNVASKKKTMSLFLRRIILFLHIIDCFIDTYVLA